MSDTLRSCARNQSANDTPKPYVAVATREGMLVNRHLGEAETLHVFEQSADGYRLVEERKTPPPGYGPKRWEKLAASLSDCRAVVVQAMGEAPHRALSGCGITPVVGAGIIEEALDVIYSGGDLNRLRGRRGGVAGSCNGAGKGCG
jgi:nitrogen fixation protein NifB